MRIRETPRRIPGNSIREWDGATRPIKDSRTSRMANNLEIGQRSPKHTRGSRIPTSVHPRVLHIAKPLTELLQKNKTFEWTERCTEAVKELIRLVTTQPVLIHPNPDKTFELEVDASNYATGAILFQ